MTIQIPPFTLDLAYLNELSGGSPEFMVEMIDVFIEQTPLYFAELSSAIAKGDWKSSGEAAHKIKPTMSFIGAEGARGLLAEIERKCKSLDNPEEIESIFRPMETALPLLIDELKIKRSELLES